MRAAAVTPGKKDTVRVIDVEKPVAGDSEVLVKVSKVGIDGTDQDINEGRYGMAPEGCDYLIIGHEAIGTVESKGIGVKALSPGDVVVSTVRRPCWERCFACRNFEADMCQTGDYLERGIKGLHGYMSQYYTELLDNMIRIPHGIEDEEVLLEPLSVAEKGIRGLFKIQERFLWSPERALVLGTGSLGLLATFILRDMGIETCTIARKTKESLKAQLGEECGGRYADVSKEPLETLPKKYGPFDIIIEATGVSKLAMEARGMVNKDGIVCLLGVYSGDHVESVHTDRLNLDMVLNNKVAFGSVSSNRTHFERGVERMASIKRKWPSILRRMLTRTVPLENVADGLRRRPDDIKVLVEMGR
jgi:threonine dehydrogenase-like Zn-dependent dehydrogenase